MTIEHAFKNKLQKCQFKVDKNDGKGLFWDYEVQFSYSNDKHIQ